MGYKICPSKCDINLSITKNIFSSFLKITMGNSSSNQAVTFIQNEEKITKIKDNFTIESDFRWKIESFTEYARTNSVRADEKNYLESPRFEMMNEKLKAPLNFRIRIYFKGYDLVNVCIVNENDFDILANVQFYVTDKFRRSVPLDDKTSTFFSRHFYHDYADPFHNLLVKHSCLDMNNVRNGKHETIRGGAMGFVRSADWSVFTRNSKRLLPGGDLRIGCKVSLSI